MAPRWASDLPAGLVAAAVGPLGSTVAPAAAGHCWGLGKPRPKATFFAFACLDLVGAGPRWPNWLRLASRACSPRLLAGTGLYATGCPAAGAGPFGPRHQPGEVIYEAARLRVLAEYGATRLKRPQSLRVHPTAANCTCKLPNPHSLHVKEPTRPSLGTYLDYLGAVSLQLHSPSLPSLSLARRRKRAAAVGWSASHAVRVREPQMQYSLLSLLLSTTAGEASSSSARR